jgi:hypothetical protein
MRLTNLIAKAKSAKAVARTVMLPGGLSRRDNFVLNAPSHEYGIGRRLTGFWGGTQPYSNWLSREDLLRALEHFGWKKIEIAFDEPDHQNGPALCLVATRD